jgi:methylmalonyl-CoA/ethylmalonyl-CoA epimerase
MSRADVVLSLTSAELRLHHFGFVVASIEDSMPGFVSSLGGTWSGEIFVDPIQKVKVAFLVVHPDDAQVELVEPNADDAPVVKFLKEKGGGLHHLCYEVEDMDQRLKIMRSGGMRIAKLPAPAVAFGGRRIAWLLTRENLLVELLESV